MHWFKSCLVGFAVFVTSLYYQGAARAQGLSVAAAGEVVSAVQGVLNPPVVSAPEIQAPNVLGCLRVARIEAHYEYLRTLLEDLQQIRDGLNPVEKCAHLCSAAPTVTDVPGDKFKSYCGVAKDLVVRRCQALVREGARERESECLPSRRRFRPFYNLTEKIRAQCCAFLQPQGLAAALQFCESEGARLVDIACSNLDDDPKLTSNQ